MKISKGWKESLTALAILVAAATVITLLSGCVPMRALAEYEHHSSIPDYYDLNTSDLAGLCMEARLSRNPNAYTAEAVACVMWELSGPPVYGRDPVGTIRLRQPIWVK